MRRGQISLWPPLQSLYEEPFLLCKEKYFFFKNCSDCTLTAICDVQDGLQMVSCQNQDTNQLN